MPKYLSTHIFLWALICVSFLLWSCSDNGQQNKSDTSFNPQTRMVPIEGEFWFPLGPAPIESFRLGADTSSNLGNVSGRASAIAVNPFNPNEIWLGTAAGGVWHSVNRGENWTPLSDNEPALAIGSVAVDGCSSDGCNTIYAGTGENAIRRDTYYGRGLLVRYSGPGVEFPTWVQRTGSPFNFELGSIVDIVIDTDSPADNRRIIVALSSGTTSSASQATVTAPEPKNSEGQGGYGLYSSDNNGVTWNFISVPGAEGVRPTDLKRDPSNAQIIYAGFYGIGLFKSRDGGNSWCPLNTGVALPAGCPSVTGLNVSTEFDHVEIAIQQNRPEMMYVSFGHCPDQLINACKPSLFATTGSDLNWEQRATAVNADCDRFFSRYTTALAVHPENANILFRGGVHLCKSTDGGLNFSLSENLIPNGVVHYDHRELIFHPAFSNILYDVNDGGIAISDNGGTSWSQRNDDLQITGFYSIAAAANTPRVIGGSQDNAGQMWEGIRRWTSIGRYVVGDGAYTVIDTTNPLTLYLGTNFGDVARSTDGGNMWAIVRDSVRNDSAFNAPIVQDPTGDFALYWGGKQLLRSLNQGLSWETVSPVLAVGVAEEITPGENVITAIGVYGGRVYVGYYGGQVFTSNSVCDASSCWIDISDGLPNAPVTDFAVDQSNSSNIYVTFSGFGAAAHIWRSNNAGNSWQAKITGIPSGVPVNAVAVEPNFPERVWVGTDSGPSPGNTNLFVSINGGTTWQPKNRGLPNAPVHDLSIDKIRNRVYAGLHGRGVFVLSQPIVNTYEGWVNDAIWDVPVFGQNFPANASCTVTLYQSTGDICAQGSVDAIGGTIRSNETGVLGSTAGGFYIDKPVIWGCLNGRCIDNDNDPNTFTPIAQCNDDENGDGVMDPLSTVVVDCGGPPGNATILGCPDLANPPSSMVQIGFFEEMAMAERTNTPLAANLAPDKKFTIAAILQKRNGTSTLCSVPITIAAGETRVDVLEKTRLAINNDSECMASSVQATLTQIPPIDPNDEDRFAGPQSLVLTAPDLVGGQIVAGLRVEPGAMGNNSCMVVRGLGTAIYSQLRIMKTKFITAPGGAVGGQLTFSESSSLGSCTVNIDTQPGQTALDIATSLKNKILSPDFATKLECLEINNPRDISQHQDGLISVMAKGLQVCLNDPGVGMQIAPEEIADIRVNDPPNCATATIIPAGYIPPGDIQPDNIRVEDPDNDTVTVVITRIETENHSVDEHSSRQRSSEDEYEVYFKATDEHGATCSGHIEVEAEEDDHKNDSNHAENRHHS